MSEVYLETSALLTWLLGQSRADEVRASVDAAGVVLTSSVTFSEAGRALVRAEREAALRAGDAQKLRGSLQRARAAWIGMAVTEEVLERAAQPFPVEPVRTLDGIHLATALAFSRAFPDLRMLTLDRRIAANAEALGIG